MNEKKQNNSQEKDLPTIEGIQDQIVQLKAQLESLASSSLQNKLAMIVFSGELDKVLSAFIIATGAVAMGMDVVKEIKFEEVHGTKTCAVPGL